MRSSTSARFSTYYKIQRWEARSFAWKDIQRSHATIEEALAAAPRGERNAEWRIMEISESSRVPV